MGRIPVERLYGPGLALLHQFPLPNVDAAPGRSYNYRVTSPVQFTLTYTPVVRIDYRPQAPLQVSLKWAGQNARATPSNGSLPGFNDPRYYEYGALQDIGAPFFVNGQSRLPPQVLWAASGTTSHISGGPPTLAFPGFMNLNRIQDFHLNVTNTAHAHTVKGGLSFQHSYKAQNVNSTGTFQGVMSFGNDTTNPLDANFPFANAALGIFSSYAQQSRFAEGQFVYDNLEGYLQDHWAVSRRVTLELGVRVVHQTPQVDTYGKTIVFSPDRW